MVLSTTRTASLLRHSNPGAPSVADGRRGIDRSSRPSQDVAVAGRARPGHPLRHPVRRRSWRSRAWPAPRRASCRQSASCPPCPFAFLVGTVLPVVGGPVGIGLVRFGGGGGGCFGHGRGLGPGHAGNAEDDPRHTSSEESDDDRCRGKQLLRTWQPPVLNLGVRRATPPTPGTLSGRSCRPHRRPGRRRLGHLRPQGGRRQVTDAGFAHPWPLTAMGERRERARRGPRVPPTPWTPVARRDRP